MRKNRKKVWFVLFLCVCLWQSVTMAYAATEYVDGYFRYTVENGSVTITGYNGGESEVAIPTKIAGNPVNAIASGAFSNVSAVKKISLPDTIMTIEEGAFSLGQTVVYKSNTENEVITQPQQPEQSTGGGTSAKPTQTPETSTGGEASAKPTQTPETATGGEASTKPTQTPETSTGGEASTKPTQTPETSTSGGTEANPTKTPEQSSQNKGQSSVTDKSGQVLSAGKTESSGQAQEKSVSVEEADIAFDDSFENATSSDNAENKEEADRQSDSEAMQETENQTTTDGTEDTSADGTEDKTEAAEGKENTVIEKEQSGNGVFLFAAVIIVLAGVAGFSIYKRKGRR